MPANNFRDRDIEDGDAGCDQAAVVNCSLAGIRSATFVGVALGIDSLGLGVTDAAGAGGGVSTFFATSTSVLGTRVERNQLPPTIATPMTAVAL